MPKIVYFITRNRQKLFKNTVFRELEWLRSQIEWEAQFFFEFQKKFRPLKICTKFSYAQLQPMTVRYLLYTSNHDQNFCWWFKNFEISSSKTPKFVFISSEVRIPNRNRCELSSENIFFCSNASRTNKNQRNPNSFGFWIFQSILTKVGDRLVDGWIMFMCWTIALQLWKHFNLCLVQIEFQFIPAFLCRLMCFFYFFFILDRMKI